MTRLVLALLCLTLSACATQSGDMSSTDASALAHQIRHIGAAP